MLFTIEVEQIETDGGINLDNLRLFHKECGGKNINIGRVFKKDVVTKKKRNRDYKYSKMYDYEYAYYSTFLPLSCPSCKKTVWIDVVRENNAIEEIGKSVFVNSLNIITSKAFLVLSDTPERKKEIRKLKKITVQAIGRKKEIGIKEGTNEIRCPYCGGQLMSKGNYCSFCGANIEDCISEIEKISTSNK